MPDSSSFREDFAGQHLVVLPDPVRAEARRHPLLRGLHVTDAGYFPSALGHEIERPKGAPTTLVILCMRGVGWVRLNQEKRELSPGCLLWLPAGTAHAYGASAEDPWTIAWAHFAGEEVGAWRQLVGMRSLGSAGLILLPADRLDEIGLDRVYQELERGYALHHQLAAAAALRRVLSVVARLGVETRAARSVHERVAAAVEKLQGEWMRPHRLEELATTAGVSVSHFSALFRRQTGFSPIDFMIRLRIKHAGRLLDTTDLGVAQIAVRVGYEDAFYFARCFRRVMGCSPRSYRKVQKG